MATPKGSPVSDFKWDTGPIYLISPDGPLSATPPPPDVLVYQSNNATAPLVGTAVNRQHPWTLDEALRLVRGLQPEAKKFGFHVCLGGSVLNMGVSPKDVDLYFLPLRGKDAQQMDALVIRLEGLWGAAEPIGGVASSKTQKPGAYSRLSFKDSTQQFTITPRDLMTSPPYTDNGVYRKKLKFLRNGDRIDAFFI